MKLKSIQTFGSFLMISIYVSLILGGCSSDDDTQPIEHPIVSFVIFPESASFGVGDQLEFFAFALDANGDTVDIEDLEVEWEWWSSDPDVFTVEEDGTATGVNPGEAYCVVEATVLDYAANFTEQDLQPSARTMRKNELNASFTGRDSAFVFIF